MRQRKGVILLGQRSVIGRIKAGDLRQLWKRQPKGAHTRQIVGLVQRRQRIEPGQLLQNRISHDHTGTKVLATVHDAMCNGLYRRHAGFAGQQAAQGQQGTLKGAAVTVLQQLLMRHTVESPAHFGRSVGLQPLNTARQHTGQNLVSVARVQRELEA